MFNIAEWKENGLIGKGTYGQVFKYHKNDEYIAYKKFICIENNSKADIVKEIGTYALLSAIGAQKIYGFTLTEQEIGIAMDCACTDLFSFFSDSNRIKYWDEISNKSIESLGKLHACGLVHSDVKPENILLYFNEDETLNKVSLADFGFCSSRPYYGIGTLAYIAPELLPVNFTRPKTKQSDIWALGISLIEFYLDEYIFHNNSNLIEKDYYAHVEPFLNKVDKPILRKMIQYNPKDRLCIDEPIFVFPKRNWAKPSKDLFNKIPIFSPYQFLTVLDICCRFLFKNEEYPNLIKDATSLAKKWGPYNVKSDSTEIRLIKGLDYLVYIPGLASLEKYFDEWDFDYLEFDDFESFCKVFSQNK